MNARPFPKERVARNRQPRSDWRRFVGQLVVAPDLGLTLDTSRIRFEDGWLDGMAGEISRARQEMDALERGATANPTEDRRVGHYWLRRPELAPDEAIRDAIVDAQERVRALAARVHDGRLVPQRQDSFTDVLHIGIGGSALGPQLVCDALGDSKRDRLRMCFLDNTDPQGIDRVLQQLRPRLAGMLTVVVSKSGKTRETLNAMHAVRQAYAGANLQFARHGVAITSEGSELDELAVSEGWLARFPVWSWVGGRTSVTSPVGLVPAALQGIPFAEMLAGAAACDQVTRRREVRQNPAILLALSWLAASSGRDQRSMVIIPYRDRLRLLSRYLQQLVMESLGKKRDLAGNIVHHGLTVYGNKGSTDQHAYVQQLRDGPDDFFVTFVEVLEDSAPDVELVTGVRAGDYLRGFLYGTRDALWESGRQSITLTLRRLDPFHLGVLIALYERAVGLYASLVRINAYDQPGVEAGKKAAARFIELQTRVLGALAESAETAESIAGAIGAPESVESVYHVLRGLAATGRCRTDGGEDPASRRFRLPEGA